MAEDKNGGGPSPILVGMIAVLVIAIILNIRFVSEVVFQWIPATVSVLLGIDVSTDAETGDPNVDLYTSGGNPETPGPVDQAFAESEPVDLVDVPVPDSLETAWKIFVPISIFVSLLLAVGVAYALVRMAQIRSAEAAGFKEETVAAGVAATPNGSQLRWARIVEQVHSDNPNDWRLAILEADIMLDELLEVQGYHGDTMGDKMKQVERSDFNTIELAWDAHKVRNKIAHEGSAHDLNEREVRRVMGLYEQVFREFHFI